MHAWIRRLMAFPFMKRERMAVCFHECFEQMAVDDMFGVEEEFRERFKAVVAYYKKFWVEEIGFDMICQFDEANRTNNHSEAFHRGVGCAVQVAHPQTLVLIQLLVKVERDAMLRFNDQRAGKNIKPNDRRLAELERQITKTTRSYNDGLFLNDVEYLSAIAKLYVEYNHKLKIARIRSSTNVLNGVAEVRDAVIKALDDQNLVIFGQDDEKARNEDDSFVEADFATEILFNSNVLDNENDQNQSLVLERSASSPSEIPMEVCPEESVSEKRRGTTKPKAVDQTIRRQHPQRKRRTLLQRMKKR